VQPVNDPPTLNGLTSVTLQANTSSGPLPFTINDVDSDVALVTVQASSSLPSLLPPGALILSGSGANRTITITPATNQTGTAVVTLVARDNGAASSSRSFRVTVRGSSAGPVITSQPVSRAATNGATVVFSVGASGAAPLTYQWRHDGNDIAGASGSTLTLANVQAADAGSYSAVVRNTSGSVTSAEATLRIVEAPRITALSRQSPTTVDISFTSTAGARCVVEYQDPADSTAWLALPALTGTGNVVTARDSNAISPARLYRVRVK
ncbi:MAG TPA: immunoglobulin domain-containing protein, partial [Candidatus Dormibacteraeota bacterium]|nr:immunoglobulin domain-containing protein [Candidatus Dormibacteraeota bacterium]